MNKTKEMWEGTHKRVQELKTEIKGLLEEDFEDCAHSYANELGCPECGLEGDHKLDCNERYPSGVEEGWITYDDIEQYFGGDYHEEEDFLAGATCNPDAPEECESCQ